MPTISLSSSFFMKELQAYSDWRTAFWRELLQNSVDANASKIHVGLMPEGEGCVVTFHDNGPGIYSPQCSAHSLAGTPCHAFQIVDYNTV
jgi:hypothetical protein